MQTNKKVLKLPQELDKLKGMQDAHHQAIKQNVKLQWREYLLGEMNKALNQKYNFYEFEEIKHYEASELKSIIVRYEQILNTFLREFARTSIEDWVQFIKDYTVPKYEKGELWPIATEPMITTNLSYKQAKKKKRSKRKDDNGAPLPPDEDELNTIIYSPSLQNCEDYLISCINQIVASNNEFLTLEAEMFRFLKMEERPNFAIPTSDEELRAADLYWIVEAKQAISKMVKENMVGPQALLDEYKKYEFVLNVDSDELLESLFNVPGNLYDKAPIEDIREQIERFYNAEIEILNLSNNHMDYPMFRIKAEKLKTGLAAKAAKIKDKIWNRCNKWCTTSVMEIDATYTNMEKRIRSTPQDEQQLVDTIEFIKVSKEKTKGDLENKLNAVFKHMNMLDEYSEYNESEDKRNDFETEVEAAFILRKWPLQIDAAISEG